MIIVDTALAKRAEEQKPLQVGLFGAGFMAKGIVNQVTRYTPGMRIAVICNRTLSAARDAYHVAGVPDDMIAECTTAAQVDDAVRAGKFAITSDIQVVVEAAGVEVVIESTGHVEYGAKATIASINAGKHMVSMNVELDATVGSILKDKADKAGVILSGCDGDQPGVQMNLLRYVKTLGLKPLLCGNIKGLQDRYRNPTTQAAFAKQWGQTPNMVTSFADGTKISMEQAIVGNATGMKVAQRGMIGIEYKGHVDEMVDMYDLDQMRELGGIVDYVVGAKPSPGIYVFAEAQDKTQAHYLNYGKLGEGPVYSFYVPWHLTALEVHISAARVALCTDTVIAPIGRPTVECVASAKIDLKAGETLDGLGYYMTYGQCENYYTAVAENLLPMGLAENCKLKRDVPKDQVLTWDDVEAPTDSLSHALRAEQDALYN
ncbi:MAG: NAD(P)-dependent oxidoreductase [Alphaproteobacteria bacterium]|nr:NAD(P)-dependent oxidoreductase [Alphaproteobacteria bacterium]